MTSPIVTETTPRPQPVTPDPFIAVGAPAPQPTAAPR